LKVLHRDPVADAADTASAGRTLHGPDLAEHAERRRRVREAYPGAVFFLPPVHEAVFAADVHYRYRPDTNIRYLAGFEEPCALILASDGCDENGLTLCVQPRDEQALIWTGPRAGTEGARETFGADHAFELDTAFDHLAVHLRAAERFFYASSNDPRLNERTLAAVSKANVERRRSGGKPLAIEDAREAIAEFRLFKSDVELELMRKAASISAAAHRRSMEVLRPGMFEFEIEALLEHDFRRGGCLAPAYGTIVAGGTGATVLHYTANDQPLRDGELMLVDAGGEYGGYAADITRTTPVGRRFSDEQAALYDVVLEAQERAIAMCRPGATVDDVHTTAVQTLCEGLVELGIVEGSADEARGNGAFRAFYMHNTSHWLGMDVHDAGRYRSGDSARPLEPGMVLTVEPGLYFRPDADVDARYRGIGIRIEDDVVVTETAPEVLTSAAPKKRSDLEKIRSAALQG
jgi:Xaa-Pro aminopeptidase